ncbi:MAG: type II toxin-antitoxin system prevent-host-death family antitoxin [SAR324 cluster bacterium]|nr:type II toxin-antitoxin system prevent-host-death family antitoxin [SAR324 cluster bacterium]
METVGIRELKQNLSKYIKMTQQGKQITITDRKKAVAVLSPFIREESEIDKLNLLAQKGIIEWKGDKPIGSDIRPKIEQKSVSEAVMEDRR